MYQYQGVNQGFPLFYLPRELRDIIYTHLLTTIHGTLENGLRFTATSVPSIACLLLCKQFTEEYCERAEKLSHLTLSDSITFNADRTLVFLPIAASSIQSVHINLFCAPPFITVNHHRQWLGPVLEQIGDLARLKINVVIRYDANVGSIERILSYDGFWTRRSGLESLNVYRALKGSNALDFGWQTDIVLRWDRSAKGGGTFERFGLNELIEM